MRTSHTLVLGVCLGATAGAFSACGSGGGGAAPPLPFVQFSTAELPPAYTGASYFASLEAVFSHPPGKFLLTQGTVPPGLFLTPNGVISGVPTQLGNYHFEAMAVDGPNPEISGGATLVTARREFDLVVLRGPPTLLQEGELPSAPFHFSYEAYLQVAGGTPPYTFSVSGGEVPPGMSLDQYVGRLGGAPSEARQEPFAFQVTVTDATGLQDTGEYSIRVVVLPLAIDPAALADAALDLAYTHVFLLTSPGGGQPYAWSQAYPGEGETDLAEFGMEITAAGKLRQRAGFPGPSKVGTFQFTVQVTDSAAQTAKRAFSLRVLPPPVLQAIIPNKVGAGPYLAKGLGFKPGARLVFGAGLSNPAPLTPTYVDAETLSFPQPPAAPKPGSVDVRVEHADGSFGLKQNAFTYPATRLEFRSAAILPVPNSPLSSTGLDAGDVNGDGLADIVHCGTAGLPGWSQERLPVAIPSPADQTVKQWQPTVGTSAGIDLLVNTPPALGAFDPTRPTFVRIVLAEGPDWHQVKFADVDVDGDLDVVAVGATGVRTDVASNRQPVIRVYLNPHPLPFAAGMAFVQSNLPYGGNVPGGGTGHVADLALGAITKGDGLPDLAYVHQDPGSTQSLGGAAWDDIGGSVSMAKGFGNGTFSALQSNSAITGLLSAAGVALGNLNGDAQADVVVSDQAMDLAQQSWNPPPSAALFSITTSKDLFGTWTPLDQGVGASFFYTECLGVTSADVTGDTRDDPVIVAGNDVNNGGWGNPALAVFPSNGTGTFSQALIVTPSIKYRYVVAYDGDGDLANDLAVTGGSGSTFDSVAVYRSSVLGKAPSLVQTLHVTGTGIQTPNIGRIARGDFDGDGKPDLCVAMSFFADAFYRVSGNAFNDRGDGVPMGVAIFLNQSN